MSAGQGELASWSCSHALQIDTGSEGWAPSAHAVPAGSWVGREHGYARVC